MVSEMCFSLLKMGKCSRFYQTTGNSTEKHTKDPRGTVSEGPPLQILFPSHLVTLPFGFGQERK